MSTSDGYLNPDQDRPLVSIVIPLYNHESHIIKCLDSLLYQECKNIEVLIIDDGSTDNSYIFASQWVDANKDKFERVSISTQKNSGLPKTMNNLIKSAHGDFILPIASDDYLLPDSINKRISFLLLNTRYDVVIGDCIIIDQEGKLISLSGMFEFINRPKATFKYDNVMRRELLLNWWVPGPSTLYRKSWFSSNHDNFYDEKLHYEDLDMYLRLLSQNKVGFLDSVMSAYRFGSNNASSANWSRNTLNNGMIASYQKNRNLFSGFDGIIVNLTVCSLKYSKYTLLGFTSRIIRHLMYLIHRLHVTNIR